MPRTGINLSLFVSYLFITKYKRRGRPVHKLIFLAAILMFLISTTHVSLGFSRLIEGFIVLRDQPGGPGAFFSDVSIPANVAKVTIHTVNSILGDGIMVSLILQLPSGTTLETDRDWCALAGVEVLSRLESKLVDVQCPYPFDNCVCK
jgi:hypothetical protein